MQSGMENSEEISLNLKNNNNSTIKLGFRVKFLKGTFISGMLGLKWVDSWDMTSDNKSWCCIVLRVFIIRTIAACRVGFTIRVIVNPGRPSLIAQSVRFNKKGSSPV